MKITEGRLKELGFLMIQTSGGMATNGLRAVLSELGHEIIPDSEPEIVRPLRIEVGTMGPTWTAVIDSSDHFGRSVLCVNNSNVESAEETRKNLIPLVSAYNAAGERKRIEVRRTGRDTWASKLVNDPSGRANGGWPSKEASIGTLVLACASDLGLEIVES